ncbi:MAG: hypothetical protein II577_04980, partial [Erysipelotrichaceae bacterium]|nr:hypothetical protein [Erysipelotrichaceae bacterium]
IYSSGFYYLTQIVFYYLYLRRYFGLNIKGSGLRMLRILICSIVMVIPAYVIHGLLPFVFHSRLVCLLVMGVLGILMLFIYYSATVYLGLPQKIFGIKDISIRKLLSRLRR